MRLAFVIIGLLSSARTLSVPSRHRAIVMKRAGKNGAAQTSAARKGAGQGFGAKSDKPPVRQKISLDETVAGFETRVPDARATCACGYGLKYVECCRPYHLRELMPETPMRTLRTRFSAFAYRLPAHLIRTTHPSNRDWDEDHARWARRLHREGMFDGFRFQSLEAEPEEAGSDPKEAFVTFRATLVPREGGAPQRFVERSQFLRDDSAGWLYGRGDVRSDDSWVGDAELAGKQLLESARKSTAPPPPPSLQGGGEDANTDA